MRPTEILSDDWLVRRLCRRTRIFNQGDGHVAGSAEFGRLLDCTMGRSEAPTAPHDFIAGRRRIFEKRLDLVVSILARTAAAHGRYPRCSSPVGRVRVIFKTEAVTIRAQIGQHREIELLADAREHSFQSAPRVRYKRFVSHNRRA